MNYINIHYQIKLDYKTIGMENVYYSEIPYFIHKTMTNSYFITMPQR